MENIESMFQRITIYVAIPIDKLLIDIIKNADYYITICAEVAPSIFEKARLVLM